MTQKISEMLRITANNSVEFYKQVADHIDYLENTVVDLQQKITQYEQLSNNEIDDFK